MERRTADARRMIGHEAVANGRRLLTNRNRAERTLWAICWLLLAAWTPAPLHRWRILLLRLFGAQVDWSAFVYGSARIWYPRHLSIAAGGCLGARAICYSMAPISIGLNAVVSQGAHLCAGTHDIDDEGFALHVRPIVIGDRAWIAAEAFVGPGVSVGEGAVLGARGCAFRDLQPWTVYRGNPALPVRARTRRDGHR